MKKLILLALTSLVMVECDMPIDEINTSGGDTIIITGRRVGD